jgi:hypothetical protein
MLKCVPSLAHIDPILLGGGFLNKENEEVLTATNNSGDTSFMVCKPSEEAKNQKVCMDVEKPAQRSTSSSSSGSKTMIDNNTYDLMEQLLIENKSLWRIKNNYKNDSSMDNETKQVWNFIEKDKEELVKILTEKLRERL